MNTEDMTAVELYDHLYKLAEAGTPEMPTKQVETIVKLTSHLTQLDRGRILNFLAGKIKIPQSQLLNLYRTFQQDKIVTALMTTPGLVRPLSTDKKYPWGISLNETIVCKFISKDVAMKAVVCPEFMTLLVAEYGE